MTIYATATPKTESGSYYRQTRQAYSGKGIYKDVDRDRLEFIQGELSADNSLARQIEFYDSRQSPKALMKQIKDAGLSPSIYASGGLPGGSGTSGTSGTGGGGNTGGTQQMLGILDAVKDIALTSAEISKTKAEKDLLKAETKETLSRSDYNEANTLYTQYQTQHQSLQNILLEAKTPHMIKQAEYAAYTEYATTHKIFNEAKVEGLNAEFLANTMDERQKTIVLNNAATARYMLLMNSEIKANEAQVDKWISDTWIAWKNSDIYEMDIEQQGEWLEQKVIQFGKENGLREKEIKSFNTRTWVQGVSYTLGSAFNAIATIYTRGAAGAPTTTTSFTDPLGTTHTTTQKGKTSPKPFNKLPTVPKVKFKL